MRVIAGSERGRRLLCPPGQRVRPTSDRVREALFDILQHRIPEARVLDLFAGTGALGIEALSRGARQAVFVDDHPTSLATVRTNLERCGLTARAQVLRADAVTYLRRPATQDAPFDVIFADPPYRWGGTSALLGRISPALLAPGGVVIYEHARKEEPPEQVGNLKRVRQQRYGDTVLSFYCFKEAASASVPSGGGGGTEEKGKEGSHGDSSVPG
ncbi:MAG TPA: 16S rRNA (guanine(966)-N(2))-methyltransferase RsmD [Firmicutes bacterium]|nr:16S rRNA (guanine(966)-N(2))-methyltransferase RsmD [Bacillota bacterium]